MSDWQPIETAYATLINAAVKAAQNRTRDLNASHAMRIFRQSNWNDAQGYRSFRPRLFEAQRGLCGYCGAMLTRRGHLTNIDHVVPRSRGGGGNIENLLLMHSRCNTEKGCDMPSKAVLRRNDEKNAAIAATPPQVPAA
jgi:CRISPR/Cas system Type II protein with McrA/HNH and RuvC-like nuclease domain